MRFNPKSAAQLALIAIAATSMAACATKKPVETATAAPLAPPTTPTAPTRTAEAPRNNVGPTVRAESLAPAPGSEQDFVVNVGSRVFFDYDQYSVRDDARPILDAQAAWLQRYPNVAVRIEGNADERGTREYNFALGARRASSVRDYLVSKGIGANRVETVSYGKERPFDTGQNEDAWAKNRNGNTAITGGARGS